MKSRKQSYSLIFFFIIFTTLPFIFLHVQALDLRNKVEVEVEEEISNSVVRIYTAGSAGSGVVIGRNKNIYTLVTVSHIIDLSNIKEIEIQDSSGQYFKVIQILKPFPNKDIAFIKFKAMINISVAIMPFLDNSFWNQIDSWDYIIVEGIANQSKEIPSATRRSSGGQLIGFVDQTKDGYDLLHTANTNVGMSGGAIYGQINSSLMSLPYSEGSEMKYKYVTQEELNQIAKKRNSYLNKFVNKVTGERGIRHTKLLEDYQKELNSTSSYKGDLQKKLDQNIKENNKFQYRFLPEIESDLFTISEKNLYKKCVSGSWRDDPKITLNSKLRKSFDKAGYRANSSWGETGIGPQKKEFDYRGKPSYILPYDCLVAVTQVNYYGNEVCYLNSYHRNSMKYLLLGIHGRAEAYTYGGKSGTGMGLFLGKKDISNWLKVNGKKLGIKLTNEESIPSIVCSKN